MHSAFRDASTVLAQMQSRVFSVKPPVWMHRGNLEQMARDEVPPEQYRFAGHKVCMLPYAPHIHLISFIVRPLPYVQAGVAGGTSAQVEVSVSQ